MVKWYAGIRLPGEDSRAGLKNPEVGMSKSKCFWLCVMTCVLSVALCFIATAFWMNFRLEAEAIDNAKLQVEMLYLKKEFRIPLTESPLIIHQLNAIDLKYGHIRNFKVWKVVADVFYHPIIVEVSVRRRTGTYTDSILVNSGKILEVQNDQDLNEGIRL